METVSANEFPIRRKRFPRRLLLSLCVLALLGGLALWILPRDKSASGKFVTVRVDTNGTPALWGIPLSNATFRRTVFKVLHAGGYKVNIHLSDAFVLNRAGPAKISQTMMDATKAGLLDTSRTSLLTLRPQNLPADLSPASQLFETNTSLKLK